MPGLTRIVHVRPSAEISGSAAAVFGSMRYGPRQIVVLVERVEYRGVDVVGIGVDPRLRIEAGLRDREHDVQHLRGIRLRERAPRSECQRADGERQRDAATPAHYSSFSMSPAMLSGSSLGA